VAKAIWKFPLRIEQFKMFDGPWCHRELRPGVKRERHTLLDHVDYDAEDERIPKAASVLR